MLIKRYRLPRTLIDSAGRGIKQMNVYGRQAGFGLEASISVGEVGLLSLSCLLTDGSWGRMLRDVSVMRG